MSSAFTTRRRVEWRDTDAAGIMHFSAFFTYMEEAEHELLRAAGLSVSMKEAGRHLSFPRVSASCDFRRPVKFEDEIDIEVRIERIGQKSVSYVFCFRHGNDEIAMGKITAVCCRVDKHPPVSVPIPDDIAEKLKVFS